MTYQVNDDKSFNNFKNNVLIKKNKIKRPSPLPCICNQTLAN